MKVALVTGGTSGIGLQTAIEMARQGIFVYVCGRFPKTYEKAKGDINKAGVSAKIKYVQTDVRDEAQVEKLLAQIKEEKGKLDYAVNAAGIAPPVPNLTENTPSPLADGKMGNDCLNTDLIGGFYSLKHEIKLMQQDLSSPKAIVVVSSINAYIAAPTGTFYATAKAGLEGMVRTAAAESAPHIRVNAIAPGPVNTPLLIAQKSPKQSTKDFLKAAAKGVPLGRVAEPQEIAKAIAFLCSDNASYVNGTILIADGGLMAFPLG